MTYEKTTWKNRLVERPRTYQLQQNADGTVTLIPKEGEVLETGTPVNAENMNKIEDELETFNSHLNDDTQHIYVDKNAPTTSYKIVVIDGRPYLEVVSV